MMQNIVFKKVQNFREVAFSEWIFDCLSLSQPLIINESSCILGTPTTMISFLELSVVCEKKLLTLQIAFKVMKLDKRM